MIVSLDEAVSILNKWKDDSAPVFIMGLRSFRAGLWAVHEGGVDWNMSLRAKVSQVSFSEGASFSGKGIVVFKADGGEMSLAMGECALSYEQNCGLPEFVEAEDGMRARSCLFIFLASNETFAIYELDAG